MSYARRMDRQLSRVPHISLLRCGFAGCLLTATLCAQDSKPFTLQQILSAPYANQLTAAPVGGLFAWVEDAEGRHNLWVGGKDVPARELTHNTEDDGQDIRQLAWSPDARFIAYTYGAESGADGKPANPAHLQRPTPLTVIVQPVDAGAKAVVVGEGRLPLFSHDGASLFYVREGQIWVACTKDCHPERSEGPASPGAAQPWPHQLVFDRGAASSLTLSPDGNTLAFISRRREMNQPAHSYVALYSLTTHTLTFPAPSTGDDSAPAWSPDGKQLAWLRAPFTEAPEFALDRTSANPWSIQLLDLVTNTTRTVYSPEANKPGSVLPHIEDSEPYVLWAVGATPASHRLLFYSEADGWTHLYSIDPSHPASPVLLTPTKNFDEVHDATVSADGTQLMISANGPRHLCFTGLGPPPPDTKSICPDDATPQLEDGRILWHHNFAEDEYWEGMDISGVGVEARFLSDGEVVSLNSDFSHTLHPEVGLYRKANVEDRLKDLFGKRVGSPPGLREPELALFKSADGVQIHGQLFLPKHGADSSAALRNGKGEETRSDTQAKHPAILFLHGGPRRQMLLGYPAMEYYSNAYAMNQYLTSRGFIVLSVNYRCGIGYGLEFRQCEGEGATGAKEYEDVLAAAKYLASRPDVDAKRIGLWGGSYGGYLTALALARNSDIFAAGVDLHGVHDWNLEDNASDWKRGNNAEQDAIGKLALASSPLGDISKWRSPILLIHGDNDPSVAYAQTPILAEALRARNSHLPKEQQVDVEELIFPDEVHEFLLHKDWLAAYTAAAAFFERTLKPEAVK